MRYLSEVWKQSIESSGRHQTVLGLVGAAVLALGGQIVSGLKTVNLVSSAFGITDLLAQVAIFIALEIIITFGAYVLVVAPIRMWYRSEAAAAGLATQVGTLTSDIATLKNQVAQLTSERDDLQIAAQRPFLVVNNNYYGTTTAAPGSEAEPAPAILPQSPQALPQPAPVELPPPALPQAGAEPKPPPEE